MKAHRRAHSRSWHSGETIIPPFPHESLLFCDVNAKNSGDFAENADNSDVFCKANPNQLRVPAGQPGGGQWLGNNSGKPKEVQKKPIKKIYKVDLNEEEKRGGHTLRDHVGKSEKDLIERVGLGTSFGQSRIDLGARAGSFRSIGDEERFTNEVLLNNASIVDSVASGQSLSRSIEWRIGTETGYEAYLSSDRNNTPTIRKTFGVTVYLRHDPSS